MARRTMVLLTLVGILVALPFAGAGAAEVTLSPVKDTTLYESATGSLGNGAGANFFTGKTANAQLRRGLIAFDVAAGVPAGATVTNARLTLSMSKTISGAHDHSLHRVTADWGEGTSDATSNEGGGAPAAPGDATWLHRFFPNDLWAAPGGDFVATPSATLPIAGIGLYTFASNAQLVADVQSWLDDPSRNFGWIIIGEEGENTTAKRFDSSENLSPTRRPQLVIAFSTGPVPFLRGNVNGDGTTDISDAVCLLTGLFGAPGTVCKDKVRLCPDAADANDDGQLNVADAVKILAHLFAQAGPLPLPFGSCGDDPPGDDLVCLAYTGCSGR